MKRVKLDGGEYWAKVVFEQHERLNVFREEHASGIGGHSGKNKAIAKTREKYYWPGVCKDIEEWVCFL